MRRLKELNDAWLLKLAWSAIIEASLWAKWFRARNRRGNSIWHPSNPRSGSGIWKKLKSMYSFLQRDSRWIVGNGKSINLWFDKLIDNVSIALRFPYIQFSENDLVADIIFDDAWHILILLLIVLQELISHATNLILISAISAPDSLSLLNNSKGKLCLYCQTPTQD